MSQEWDILLIEQKHQLAEKPAVQSHHCIHGRCLFLYYIVYVLITVDGWLVVVFLFCFFFLNYVLLTLH